jgi:hypothetical protein
MTGKPRSLRERGPIRPPSTLIIKPRMTISSIPASGAALRTTGADEEAPVADSMDFDSEQMVPGRHPRSVPAPPASRTQEIQAPGALELKLREPRTPTAALFRKEEKRNHPTPPNLSRRSELHLTQNLRLPYDCLASKAHQSGALRGGPPAPWGSAGMTLPGSASQPATQPMINSVRYASRNFGNSTEPCAVAGRNDSSQRLPGIDPPRPKYSSTRSVSASRMVARRPGNRRSLTAAASETFPAESALQLNCREP